MSRNYITIAERRDKVAAVQQTILEQNISLRRACDLHGIRASTFVKWRDLKKDSTVAAVG